jgi:hypothetical protein
MSERHLRQSGRERNWRNNEQNGSQPGRGPSAPLGGLLNQLILSQLPLAKIRPCGLIAREAALD